jgi:hypothetical protein
MQGQVKTDRTVRTIIVTIEPGSVPDHDVTRSWHKKPRIIRPDSLTVVTTNGDLDSVALSGGLVLKSGAASTEVKEADRWYGWYGDHKLSALPGWLAPVVQAIIDGQTVWHGVEVQAL